MIEQIKATAQQIARDVFRSGVDGSQAADLIWAASEKVFGSLSARAALDLVAEVTQRDEALVARATDRLEEFTPFWEEAAENLDDEIGLDDDGLDEYYRPLAIFIVDELAHQVVHATVFSILLPGASVFDPLVEKLGAAK